MPSILTFFKLNININRFTKSKHKLKHTIRSVHTDFNTDFHTFCDSNAPVVGYGGCG